MDAHEPIIGFRQDPADLCWAPPHKLHPNHCSECHYRIDSSAMRITREDGARVQLCDACAKEWFTVEWERKPN